MTCAGTRAPEMAVRLKYAGLDPERITVHDDIPGSLDSRGRRGAGPPLRPPHLHRAPRAEDAPLRARACKGVLGMSVGTPEEAVIWHDVENGAYEADLALWRELALGAGGPVLEVGCGTGRVAIDLARHGHHVLGVDIEPAFVSALRERAAEREPRGERGGRRRPRPGSDRRVRARDRSDADDPALGGRRWSAALRSRACAGSWRRGA